MVRSALIIGSTFLFTVLGFIIGWLYVESRKADGYAGDMSYLLGYGAAPASGAVFGLMITFMAVGMFSRSDRDDPN